VIVGLIIIGIGLALAAWLASGTLRIRMQERRRRAQIIADFERLVRERR
jgi:hypothetical protein